MNWKQKILEWVDDELLAWYLVEKIRKLIAAGKASIPAPLRNAIDEIVSLWRSVDANPVFTSVDETLEILRAASINYESLSVSQRHEAARAALSLLNGATSDMHSHMYGQRDAFEQFVAKVFPDPEFYKSQQ